MRADVGQVKGQEDVLKAAVLTGTAVDQRPDNVRAEGAQRGDGARIDVEDEDGVPQVLEHLSHAVARAQGDIALMAEATGKDGDTKRLGGGESGAAHRGPQIWSGAGATTPSS